MEVSLEVSWLGTWIKAQAQFLAKDYASAILTYKSLDTHGMLKDNTVLTVNMAYCYYYMCEEAKAMSLLQKVSQFWETKKTQKLKDKKITLPSEFLYVLGPKLKLNLRWLVSQEKVFFTFAFFTY